MVETKLFEIRDDGTLIPVMCNYFDLTGSTRDPTEMTSEQWLLRRAGFGGANVIVTKLSSMDSRYGSLGWIDSRTMSNAHKFIADNWHDLVSGQVIDVEYILGETEKPKTTERLTTSEKRSC